MNKLIINGRIANDLKIETFGDGVEYCNFSVAVDRGYKSKDGSRPTDFFNCKTTRQQASFLTAYFKKGDGILLEGSMESRKYEKDGKTFTAWEMNVAKIYFPVGQKSNNSEASLPDVAEPTFTEIESAGDLPF